jgi:hypothetical protein
MPDTLTYEWLQVSAPGVWLSSREDVYVSISLFGQYRNTNLVPSIFPLLIKEDFVFEKVFTKNILQTWLLK